VKKSDFLANSRSNRVLEGRQRGDEFHSAICQYWRTGTAGTSQKYQDWRTKNPEFKKPNHRPQLGGYLSLLWQQYPQIDIDSCRIYWVSPKETTTNDYDPTDCLTTYEAARSIYFQKQLPF
jgi:hypothetical protein